MSVFCPHCGVVLAPAPKRKAACKSCHKDIYVRSKQNVAPHHLNEVDAISVDAFSELKYQYFSDADFKNKQEELSRKFGKPAKPRDVVWSLYNQLLNSLSNKRKYAELAAVYHSMALFLNQLGEDYVWILKQAKNADLLRYQMERYSKVSIMGGPICCSDCGPLDKKEIEIKQAIEQALLPYSKCSHIAFEGRAPLCVCMYLGAGYPSR